MKPILKPTNLCGILAISLLIASVSCKKYNSLGFTPGTGAPTITSVHTLNKTDTSLHIDTIWTYNTNGTVSYTLRYTSNYPVPFDSVTTAGNLGAYFVIEGTNLGSATDVSFNGVSVYLNRAWMTDHSIIVSIPQNVPATGPQAIDTMAVTTLHGKALYKFTIIPPPPTISSWSDYDFWSGSQITLTGVGFSSVTSAGLTGTTATVTIVSQTDKQLVLQFPATTVTRASLVLKYTGVGQTITQTSQQELVDLDNAYNIFFKDNFQNTWVDNSWTAAGIKTAAHHAFGGTASASGVYPAGAWQIEGWAGWNNAQGGLPYDPAYKYLTFWVLGGTVQHTLVLVGDKVPGGYSQNTSAPAIQQILTTPGTWTYYKIPLGSGSGQLNFWASGNLAQQLGFFLQGQNGDVNETMYFDEIAFVK
jgi:hypothetical protein